ncbi:hypothetical protein ACLKA6_019577 [Drosophila palustris]
MHLCILQQPVAASTATCHSFVFSLLVTCCLVAVLHIGQELETGARDQRRSCLAAGSCAACGMWLQQVPAPAPRPLATPLSLMQLTTPCLLSFELCEPRF